MASVLPRSTNMSRPAMWCTRPVTISPSRGLYSSKIFSFLSRVSSAPAPAWRSGRLYGEILYAHLHAEVLSSLALEIFERVLEGDLHIGGKNLLHDLFYQKPFISPVSGSIVAVISGLAEIFAQRRHQRVGWVLKTSSRCMFFSRSRCSSATISSLFPLNPFFRSHLRHPCLFLLLENILVRRIEPYFLDILKFEFQTARQAEASVLEARYLAVIHPGVIQRSLQPYLHFASHEAPEMFLFLSTLSMPGETLLCKASVHHVIRVHERADLVRQAFAVVQRNAADPVLPVDEELEKRLPLCRDCLRSVISKPFSESIGASSDSSLTGP